MVKNDHHWETTNQQVNYYMNIPSNQTTAAASNSKEIYPWMNDKKYGNNNNTKKTSLSKISDCSLKKCSDNDK